jgi:hypothetical protein
MGKFHDHRPTRVVKRTFEIGYQWQVLDSNLAKYEKEFNQNMHDYMDLIHHYENLAENQNL